MNFESQIAELALESRSLHEFHTEVLAVVSQRLGAEAGFAGTQRCQRDDFDLETNFVDPKALWTALMVESQVLTPCEVKHCLDARFRRTDMAFAARRPEHASIVRDYFRPLGIENKLFRIWTGPGTVHIYGFSTGMRGDFDRFCARAMPSLDSVAPIVELAERLLGSAGYTADTATLRDVTREFRLTNAEHQAVELLARGLTNQEIARVLGVSINTIRNRLVTCFRKLDVTTRSEAVSVLHHTKHDEVVACDATSLSVFNRVVERAHRDMAGP